MVGSDPTRARLLLALRDAPGYPAELADLFGAARQNSSNHLACLADMRTFTHAICFGAAVAPAALRAVSTHAAAGDEDKVHRIAQRSSPPAE